MKPTAPFEPHVALWNKSSLISVAGCVAGAAAWVLQAPVVAGVIGLAVAHQAWKAYKDANTRHHGLEVESQYLDVLRKACDANGWTLNTDEWIDGVGNLDAVIHAGAAAVVVELKSYWGLRVIDGRVVRCNRAHTSAAREVSQVNSQVSAYSFKSGIAKPVGILWCPAARFNSARMVGTNGLNDIGLVNGSVSGLVEIIRQADLELKQKASAEYLSSIRKPEPKEVVSGALLALRARFCGTETFAA